MDQHPLETTLKLSNGSEYRVLNSMLGLMRAEKIHGHDTFGAALDADSAEAAVAALKGPGLVTRMLETVWIAALHFDAALSQEALAAQVTTPADMREVARVFWHIKQFQLTDPEPEQKKSPDEAGQSSSETSKHSDSAPSA